MPDTVKIILFVLFLHKLVHEIFTLLRKEAGEYIYIYNKDSRMLGKERRGKSLEKHDQLFCHCIEIVTNFIFEFVLHMKFFVTMYMQVSRGETPGGIYMG